MNFKAIVEEFLNQDALIQLPKLDEKEIPEILANQLSELLQNEKRRSELAENAHRVANNNRGATEKTIHSIKEIL